MKRPGDAGQPLTPPQTSPLDAEQGGHVRDLLVVSLIAAAFFVVYLVDAGRQDFTNASENVVVQAAIEAHQGGPWWIPNLEGKPRILKPPFPTWLAILGMHDATLAATITGDLPAREAAFHQLAFEARWPFCLSAALTLVVVFLLGRLLAGQAVGFASALICGSTLLFLRFGTMANTDIQLTLWVALANLCLAVALQVGNYVSQFQAAQPPQTKSRPSTSTPPITWHCWFGWAGAGLALGLAMMSKGPVGLIQSLLPIGAFVLYRKVVGVEGAPPTISRNAKWLAPMLGIAILAAISLPWPISVIARIPDAIQQWWTDVFNPAGTADRPRPWWGYIALVPNMVPWLPLFIGGLCLPFLSQYRKKPIILAWMLFVVPVVAMSFGKDKNERYGLPMVVGAALLCGYVAVHLMRNRKQLAASDRLVLGAQVFVTIGFAFAILLGAIPLTGSPKTAWFDWSTAITATVAALAVLAAAFVLRKRIPWIGIPATAAVSLILYHMVIVGSCSVPLGQSDYKHLAITTAVDYPDAEYWFCDPRPEPRHTPTDLAIYTGHPVRNASKLTDPPTSTRTQVMFVLEQKNDPEPVVNGWQLWKREGVENRFCCAFVRRPNR